jgi:hypothetical protein
VGRPPLDDGCGHLRDAIADRERRFAETNDPNLAPPDLAEVAALREKMYPGCDSLEQDLEKYADHLAEVRKTFEWQLGERRLAMDRGERDPEIPWPHSLTHDYPSYHPMCLEEVLEWTLKRRAILRAWQRGLSTLPEAKLRPAIRAAVEAEDNEDFPEGWNDLPDADSSQPMKPPEQQPVPAAPQPAAPQPAAPQPEQQYPLPMEGEKRVDYLKRFAAEVGCGYFVAQEAVKRFGLWKK